MRNLSDIIETVHGRTGKRKYEIDLIAREIFGTIADELAAGESVSIPAFGVFTTLMTKPRAIKSFDGSPMVIEPHRCVKFHVNRVLKRLVLEEEKEKEIDYDEEGFD